jgi:general secretion pathway protein D
MTWRERGFSCAVLAAMALLLAGCAGERYHHAGLRLLAEGKAEEGLRSLEQASKDEPGNVVFRADLLNRRAEQANRLLAEADSARAAAKPEAADLLYQRVLAIMPGNPRAAEGIEALARERRYAPIIEQAGAAVKKGDTEQAQALLRAVLSESPANTHALALKRAIDDQQIRERVSEPLLRTNQKKPISLEFRDANLKVVLEALTRAAGVNFILDKDVRPDLRTTIFLRQSSLDDAIELLLQTNGLEKKVLNRNTVIVYPGTPDKLKEYQELVVKGFYLSNADVKQTQVMLKSLLKAKDTFIDEKLNLLVMRDTPEAIRLAEKLITMHDLYEPEVMLEVEVLEVKRSRLTELGVQWPGQLSLTPLVPSGPVTLASLRGLNAERIGVSLPSATVNLRREIGDAKILANPRIRARNREKAKVMIGDKVPVVTVTTGPTGGSSESMQYLDVGIKLDVEPNVYLQDEVAIRVGLEVSSLVREVRTPLGSLAYQIGSRSASTVLRLKDGETQVLAGLISDEDRSTASRVPGIGDLPLLGRLFGSQKDDREKTEIVLSITPRLVRNINRPDAANSEFWSGTEAALRTKPLTLELPRAAEGNEDPPATDGLDGNVAPSMIGLSWQGPSSAKVGELFKVALRMKSDGGIRSLPVQIGFDSAALQVVEITEGPFFKQREAGTSISSSIDQAGGKAFVSVVRSGTDGARGDDSVVVLHLRALTAKPSDIKLLMAAPVSMGDKSLVPALPAPFVVNVGG